MGENHRNQRETYFYGLCTHTIKSRNERTAVGRKIPLPAHCLRLGDFPPPSHQLRRPLMMQEKTERSGGIGRRRWSWQGKRKFLGPSWQANCVQYAIVNIRTVAAVARR